MPEVSNEQTSSVPKLFISYRWSSPQHEEWVLALATNLRADGVEVILDKWHLKDGNDTLSFMERMVSDPEIKKVLMICDKGYVNRANSRTGGVGTEAQIISSEVYRKVDQNKFGAAVTEFEADGTPALPIYFATRLYFNFSTSEAYSENYEKVLRWCWDKPFYAVPPIGEPPAYLNSTYSSLSAPNVSSIALRADRARGHLSDKTLAPKALNEISVKSLELLLDLSTESIPDELVHQHIYGSIPLREQAFEAVSSIFEEEPSDERASDLIHDFLESLLTILLTPNSDGPYTLIDKDALRFFAHIVFVGTLSIAIRKRRFLAISRTLSTPFFSSNRDHGLGQAISYNKFVPNLVSLDELRKSRLKLNRISIHADYIKDTLHNSSVSLLDFMESDFILYIRGLIGEETGWPLPRWYPSSLMWATYSDGSFPMFVRAESRSFYTRISPLFSEASLDSLKEFLRPYTEGRKNTVRFDYNHLEIASLANLERLGRIP